MRGPAPVPWTAAHAWLLARGINAAELARRAGVHYVLAHRHLAGRLPMSARTAALYRVAFPGFEWPARGLLRRFKRPCRVVLIEDLTCDGA